MKRALLTIGLLALLSGCYKDKDAPEYYTKELSSEGFKNSGLSDCKSYKTRPNLETGTVYVTRCPNSTTSTEYASGKSRQTVIVIDGVEYVKKEP